MKKFLTTVLACLLVCVGLFTLYGCEPERDFNGVYRLDYAFYGEGADTPQYQYELADTEVYIVINETVITEYVFAKTDASTKRLISMQVMNNLTLPEFVVTKEGNVEYFTNFTNLNRYDEGTNQYKIARWSYVKVTNLPVILQNSLVPYFGKYVVDTSAGSNLVVSDLSNCSLTLNGNLIIKDGETTTTYNYVSGSNRIHTFEYDGTRVQLEVVNSKLTVYFQETSANGNYIIWKIDTPIEEL